MDAIQNTNGKFVSTRTHFIDAVADALISMDLHIGQQSWDTLHVMTDSVGKTRKDCAVLVGRRLWYYMVNSDNHASKTHLYRPILDVLRWNIVDGLQEGYTQLLALVLRLTQHSITHKAVETALNNSSKFQTLPAKHLPFEDALTLTLKEYLVNE